VPYFFNHTMWLGMLGIEARHIPSVGAGPRPEDAAAVIDTKTRAIVLCTPNNPTGAIYPPQVIDAFFDLAREHGIRSLPTMRLFRHGEIVEEILGAQTESTLRILLDRYIERESDKFRASAIETFMQGRQEEALEMLQRARQAEQADLHGRIGQFVNLPGHRHRGELRAHAGEKRAGPEDGEVAVVEGDKIVFITGWDHSHGCQSSATH